MYMNLVSISYHMYQRLLEIDSYTYIMLSMIFIMQNIYLLRTNSFQTGNIHMKNRNWINCIDCLSTCVLVISELTEYTDNHLTCSTISKNFTIGFVKTAQIAYNFTLQYSTVQDRVTNKWNMSSKNIRRDWRQWVVK